MSSPTRRSRAAALSIVLLAGAGLTACASSSPISVRVAAPRYPIRVQAEPAPAPGPQAATPAPTAGVYKVGAPYEIRGVWYTPAEQPDYDETGVASWYGEAFQARPTANGETFDMNLISAAHTTLPMPSLVEVTNLENGRSIQVRVNDRGPFVDDRIIDLSRAAAEELGMLRAGLARVRVRYVGPAPLWPETHYQLAQSSEDPAAGATGLAPPFTPVTTSVIEASPLGPPVQTPLAEAPEPLVTLAGYEVQAAAFSSLANAERAQAALSGAGDVSIRPVERDGVMLYRVVVSRIRDENEALSLVARIGGLGFPDARVIRPL